MFMLTRETILASNDIIVEPIDLPEWGDGCFIRVMTGAERGKFEQEVNDGKTQFSQYRQKLAVILLCDDKGNRIFKDEDYVLLGQRNSRALDRIMIAGQKLNCIRGQKDFEELEKNSGKTQTDNSISS